MNVVVDANIVVKWFIAEEDSEDALALRARADVLAPDIMLIEYRNALLSKVRRRVLSIDEARRFEREINGIDIAIVPSEPLLEHAFRIALDLGEPIYDCIYLAAAVTANRILITADAAFVAAAGKSSFGPRIKLLSALATGI
jgi:predicted nucleic acid-binding protein